MTSEQLLKGSGLFYDRRKGFYKDQGKPIKKIVSVNALAQAVISVMLQRPDDARARPGDYFKDDDRYKSVFGNAKYDLSTYLNCIELVRRVETFLNKKGVDPSDRKNLVFYVAALVAREQSGLRRPVSSKLPTASNISDTMLASALREVSKFYKKLAQTADGDSVARGPSLLKKIDSKWERRRRNAKKAKR